MAQSSTIHAHIHTSVLQAQFDLSQSETDPLLGASLPQRCGNFSMKFVINYTYLTVWNDEFSTAPKIITILPDKKSKKLQESSR